MLFFINKKLNHIYLSVDPGGQNDADPTGSGFTSLIYLDILYRNLYTEADLIKT